MRSFLILRQSIAALSSFGFVSGISHADVNTVADDSGQRSVGKVKQPTFGNSANVRTKSEREKRNLSKTTEKVNKILLLSGSGHPQLSKKVADLIDLELGSVNLGRFMDGEVSVRVNSELRGKHVYIIQSCAAPVSDNAMELLLMTSCVRRSGAARVTTVIPYFGYKHHRKATPVSNKHQSRFLTSGAMDFAKMLEVMEVDNVVAVDIQRPGQGQEACYFSAHVPLECVVTRKLFVDHLTSSVLDIKSGKQIVVVAPNAESLKRATKYQVDIQNRIWELQELHKIESKLAGKVVSNLPLMNHPGIRIVGFFGEESGSGYDNNPELLGKAQVGGICIVVLHATFCAYVISLLFLLFRYRVLMWLWWTILWTVLRVWSTWLLY